MLCLFRNSVLTRRLHFLGSLLSWLAVGAWLHFSFVEKALWFKLLAGDAILVDLLLGIPLVLMLAVVVYATVFWLFKLLIIALFPQGVVPVTPPEDASVQPDLSEQEAQFGTDYWHEETARSSTDGAEASAKSSEAPASRSF